MLAARELSPNNESRRTRTGYSLGKGVQVGHAGRPVCELCDAAGTADHVGRSGPPIGHCKRRSGSPLGKGREMLEYRRPGASRSSCTSVLQVRTPKSREGPAG
jgi:hypothetical protein